MANDNYPFNQFANMGDYETITYGRQTSDNAEYLYPGNLIPNIYDSPDEKRTDTVVQRGFIRGIMPQVINDNPVKKSNKVMSFLKKANVPVRRCFFQFNPSLILRSVQASSTTLNPLIQDPAQLVQPIPGQSSFEFQLLFNREREVSNQRFAPPGRTGLQQTSKDPVNVESGTVTQEDVGSIGVLADLHVLDSIIGQSITQDLVNMVQAYWAVSSSLTNQANRDTEDFTAIDLQQFGQEDFKKKLASVYGNTAFLNPMPVRIVFSSLFMVEGFVTASNVAFHKFTKNMVPTVCTVTLSVQALYIGFAKKNAFLTDQLTQQFVDIDKKGQETTENVIAGTKLLDDHFNISLSKFGYDYAGIFSLNQYIKTSWDQYQEGGKKYFWCDPSKGEGLEIWYGDALRNAFGLKLDNLKIDSIYLTFLKTDKLPSHLKGTALLQNVAKNGLQLLGQRGQKPEWVAATVSVFTNSGNETSDNTFKINYEDIKKAKYTKDNPYHKGWISTPIVLTGDPGTEFFGSTSTTVLVTCRVSATVNDADGEKQIPIQSLKVASYEFNPSNLASSTDFYSNKVLTLTTIK